MFLVDVGDGVTCRGDRVGCVGVWLGRSDRGGGGGLEPVSPDSVSSF